MNIGIRQHGTACCVIVGNPSRMRFVTSSDVVAKFRAIDHEPMEVHPSREEKNKGGPVVVCSKVKEWGPFSFLKMDTTKLGDKANHELACLDFKEIPDEKRESDFEAYTFDSSEKPLKLKVKYQKSEKKHELLNVTKNGLKLDEPFVLGAPIIMEIKSVKSKYLSSRWSLVGVIGLNDKSEPCPYFVYANMFDSKPVQSEGECSVFGNELNATATSK
ncbi:uncharacterized protein LOC122956822 [Acropora millepora]|uniref:uncharacterized protein LOC122956822 n=1 Tax=Acropora millepora TaxID=45264 RepID=UPI001CF23AE9|nr:uncharacterized protein LOC122956822 [Acropora millepora]